jgi:hypothetical protein
LSLIQDFDCYFNNLPGWNILSKVFFKQNPSKWPFTI